jgi:hypothetical protein
MRIQAREIRESLWFMVYKEKSDDKYNSQFSIMKDNNGQWPIIKPGN